MTTGARQVEVLAIAGTGQNGATLLTRMLGMLPGVVAVGELGRLWDTGLLENRDCACGVPFRSCQFWRQVGDVAFGGWDAIDGYEVAQLRESVRLKRRFHALPNDPIPSLRKIWTPQLLPFRPGFAPWPRYRRNVRRYADLMGRLYGAIAEATGATVIVDSMKVPYHVFLLRRVRGIDLRVVHLVRDSRGVGHSQAKVVEKQGSVRGSYRGRRHPAKTALRWDWVNTTFHLLGRLRVPLLLVRYEDVVRDPAAQLSRLSDFASVSLSPDELAFVQGREVDLPGDHLVAGNRMRMEAGPILLRDPDGWRKELSDGQRRVVTFATWPLLRRYGYLRARPAAAPDGPAAS